MKKMNTVSFIKAKKTLKYKLARFKKYIHLRNRIHTCDSHPLFVFACQRSGTNMLVDLLDKSPDTWSYNEGHPKAFKGMRIRSDAEIDRLIKKNRCKWTIFKPLCDSHYIDKIIQRHPNAKAIWIYREYSDVANSAIRHFGNHHYNMIRDIATESSRKHWIGERLTQSSLQTLRYFYSKGLSDHEAAVLKWYLHNKLLFDYIDIDKLVPDRLIILKYEDIVTEPKKYIPRIFSHFDIEFSDTFIPFIYHSSVSKNPPQRIIPDLADLCEDMQKNLFALYQRQKNILS